MSAKAEVRRRALDLLAEGATLREAAAKVGVSHETVRTWAKAARTARLPQALRPPPEPVARGERKPVYVNGMRLGRLALWN